MGRELTEREREVVGFLLDAASPLAGEGSLTADRRDQLRESLVSARAGKPCPCGACPSIEIEDRAGATSQGGKRVVLSAAVPNASVLLFIDGGRLSYLELAPHDNEPVREFPPVTHLRPE